MWSCVKKTKRYYNISQISSKKIWSSKFLNSENKFCCNFIIIKKITDLIRSLRPIATIISDKIEEDLIHIKKGE